VLLRPYLFLLLDAQVAVNLGIIEAVGRIDQFLALDQRILLIIHCPAGVLVEESAHSLPGWGLRRLLPEGVVLLFVSKLHARFIITGIITMSSDRSSEERSRSRSDRAGRTRKRYKYCCRKCKHTEGGRKSCVCVVPLSQRRTEIGERGCQTCGCNGCSIEDYRSRGEDPEYRPMVSEPDRRSYEHSE
jgi:hypothetical protein